MKDQEHVQLNYSMQTLIVLVILNKQYGQCQARAIHSFKICMFIIFSANHMPSPHNPLFFPPPPWRVTCRAIIHITFFFSYPHITSTLANQDKSKHYQIRHTLGQVESNSYTNTQSRAGELLLYQINIPLALGIIKCYI